MEDEKTFYTLLCEGVEVGELVDAVEAGKVRVFDKYGRGNQVPSTEDKAELLSSLAHYQKMKWEKDLPSNVRSQECLEYWHFWTFYLDCGGDLPPILARAWIVVKPKNKAKSINSTFNSETAEAMADKRHGPANAEKDKVKLLAAPLIERGQLRHNQIAKEIKKNNNLFISYPMVLAVVKEECRRMNRDDLIKGLK